MGVGKLLCCYGCDPVSSPCGAHTTRSPNLFALLGQFNLPSFRCPGLTNQVIDYEGYPCRLPVVVSITTKSIRSRFGRSHPCQTSQRNLTVQDAELVFGLDVPALQFNGKIKILQGL